ncbi:GntR family transcriptional regulator [bacterium]|nr:GntR family transcriptional regulator [bacterium]
MESTDKLTIRVNLESEVPIYVQVKNQIRYLIDRGKLPSGMQLPTVRDMALQLGINANTVSRIYSDLEREGYLSRKRGVGTFAVDPNEGSADNGLDELPGIAQLRETVRQLRSLGYSARQIQELTGEVLGREA